MSAESTMRWLLLTIRWAANQRIARSHCLQGKWLATKLRTSRPKLPRRSSAVSRRHLVNTLRSWVHCAQPVDVNHLVVSTVWLGSPRETHLRNGFGESGFETTIASTNGVALLPSGQRVGLQFSKTG